MNRVTSIKESLDGIGTQLGVYYSNQEIVDRLKNLQSKLAQGVFEKTHAKNFTEREVLRHLTMLASDYGLENTERFLRLNKNLNKLGYTIGSYINGMAGERNAKKALKLISMDRGVKILYNICLEDEDCQAEYDALVVAPYGLFLIEVKNWFGTVTITSNGLLKREGQSDTVSDLSGKMSVKEALLKEHLGDLFPKQYINMLLFSNEKVEVIDEYHRIPFFTGNGISLDIRMYSKNGNILTDKQINKIVDRLLSSHREQKTLCDVNCEEIIDDYAHLMFEIEEKVKYASLANISDSKINQESISKAEQEKNKSFWSSIDWGSVLKVGAAAIIGIPAAFLGVNGIIQLIKRRA